MQTPTTETSATCDMSVAAHHAQCDHSRRQCFSIETLAQYACTVIAAKQPGLRHQGSKSSLATPAARCSSFFGGVRKYVPASPQVAADGTTIGYRFGRAAASPPREQQDVSARRTLGSSSSAAAAAHQLRRLLVAEPFFFDGGLRTLDVAESPGMASLRAERRRRPRHGFRSIIPTTLTSPYKSTRASPCTNSGSIPEPGTSARSAAVSTRCRSCCILCH